MAVTVVHNLSSLTAQRHLSKTQRGMESALGRLASGMRIVSAADDAAGLAISESLRSQVRGLAMARRNATDGISMLQTAEGALNETHGLLMRMRELAVQSSNGTMGTAERALIQEEFAALSEEIDRLADVTEFNGQHLLNASTTVDLQVGIHSGAEHVIQVEFANARVSSLATSNALGTASVGTQTGAQAALAVIDEAISTVSSIRGGFGAAQNRLTVAIDTLAIAEENLTAAEARVRDADIAAETAALTKNQILMQAGVSVLAQANQIPAIAMSLIG